MDFTEENLASIRQSMASLMNDLVNLASDAILFAEEFATDEKSDERNRMLERLRNFSLTGGRNGCGITVAQNSADIYCADENLDKSADEPNLFDALQESQVPVLLPSAERNCSSAVTETPKTTAERDDKSLSSPASPTTPPMLSPHEPDSFHFTATRIQPIRKKRQDVKLTAISQQKSRDHHMTEIRRRPNILKRKKKSVNACVLHTKRNAAAENFAGPNIVTVEYPNKPHRSPFKRIRSIVLCKFCNIKIQSKSYDHHVRRLHGGKGLKFRCSTCKQRFSSARACKVHITRSACGSDNFESQPGPSSKAVSLISPNAPAYIEGSLLYKCSDCQRKFVCQNVFNLHTARKRHNPKPLVIPRNDHV